MLGRAQGENRRRIGWGGTLLFLLWAIGCRSAPTLERIEPESGPETGGTVLTAYGRRFSDDAKITFNGAPLLDTIRLDARRLQVTLPPREPGRVKIGVVNLPDRPAAEVLTFEYLDTTPPFIVLIEPAGELPAETALDTIRVTYSERLSGGAMTVTDEAGRKIGGETFIEGTLLRFTASAPFPPGHTYTATLRDVTDPAGNRAETERIQFSIAAP